jgi:hypothetical protein
MDIERWVHCDLFSETRVAMGSLTPAALSERWRAGQSPESSFHPAANRTQDAPCGRRDAYPIPGIPWPIIANLLGYTIARQGPIGALAKNIPDRSPRGGCHFSRIRATGRESLQTLKGLLLLVGWLLWGDLCSTLMGTGRASIIRLKLNGLGAPSTFIALMLSPLQASSIRPSARGSASKATGIVAGGGGHRGGLD